MAKTNSTPTLRSAICSAIGSSSQPKSVVVAPNGTGAKAMKQVATEMIGASENSSLSAALGCSSSLKNSLTMSAIGCSRPFGPTSHGP